MCEEINYEQYEQLTFEPDQPCPLKSSKLNCHSDNSPFCEWCDENCYFIASIQLADLTETIIPYGAFE